MRRWWHDKDFSDVLSERVITSEKGIQSIIDEIKSAVEFYNESSAAGVK